jgi:hypothetical protein
MLSMRGESFTIVSEGSAFTEHFLSGTYNTYALFSEQIELSESTKKALREAVFRGEGLLVTAGGHDHRNHRLNEVLGIHHRGKPLNAYAVEMDESELSTAQQLALQLQEKVISTELKGAESAGRFLFEDKQMRDSHREESRDTHGEEMRDAHGEQNPDAHGVTLNDYGEGQAVYLGYDLLAEAVLAGAASPQADLMLSSLTAVAPLQDIHQVGTGVPVILSLTNQGIATPGRAIITLPDDVALIDSGAALLQSDGTLIWYFDIQLSETVALTLWLQPLTEENDLPIDVLIQTGTSEDYLDYESLSLTLALSPVPLLTDLSDQLAQLADDDKAYRKAQRYLQKARRAQERSKLEEVFENLLRCSDELTKLDTAQARAIRLKLAELIRQTGMTLESQTKPQDDEKHHHHDHHHGN